MKKLLYKLLQYNYLFVTVLEILKKLKLISNLFVRSFISTDFFEQDLHLHNVEFFSLSK